MGKNHTNRFGFHVIEWTKFRIPVKWWKLLKNHIYYKMLVNFSPLSFMFRMRGPNLISYFKNCRFRINRATRLPRVLKADAHAQAGRPARRLSARSSKPELILTTNKTPDIPTNFLPYNLNNARRLIHVNCYITSYNRLMNNYIQCSVSVPSRNISDLKVFKVACGPKSADAPRPS